MPDQNDIPFDQFIVDFFGALAGSFVGGDSSSSGDGAHFLSSFIDFLVSFWSVFVVLSWLATILLIIGIIYAYIKGSHYSELMMEMIHTQERLWAEAYRGGTSNKRWEDVQAHIASDSPHQWRLAIIEADIMLGELLDTVGYAGTTIGEKLKSASPSSFATLNQAWRAHQVRNQVAHEGADFVLTKKIALDTITQYRMVFDEFGLI